MLALCKIATHGTPVRDVGEVLERKPLYSLIRRPHKHYRVLFTPLLQYDKI